MSIKIFKIYGIQRTRTNYLQKFMQINYKNVLVLSNLGGWKHGLVQTEVDWSGSNWEETEQGSYRFFKENLKESNGLEIKLRNAFKNNQVNFLFCFRNPYDNYLSMRKHAKNKNVFHVTFVKNWNEKNKNYLSFIENNDNVHYFRFEDFADNREEVFTNLKNKFNLETKNEEYIEITNTVNPRLKITGNKFFYSRFDERDFPNKELRKYFKENLDLEIMSKLNYGVLQ
tara:strand:+ start:5942 stop:6625 length:684 start_codon:yes stop_codon:yes gene_type:complete